MRFIIKIALVAVVALSFNSCVSVQKNMKTKREIAEAGLHVEGRVRTQYTSFQWFHFHTNAEKKAYKRLMIAAREKYDLVHIDIDDIDLLNIRAKGEFSGYQVPMILLGWYPIVPLVILGNFQKVSATADVIQRNQSVAPVDRTATRHSPIQQVSPQIPSSGKEEAIQKVCASLMRDLPNGAKIAVINVNSTDLAASALVINEVEFNLVSAKSFTVVDRHTLDVIRREQSFQMGGEVSDESVVAVGHLAGATVVIAGEITNVGGNRRRLSLKALDVQTGRIIVMARELY